ncbi:terminase large subunit domain-containing protein, partial [Sphingomonas sp.]|uniref:terminase large subunit domain-containing protein n=1 Tax=Sphingomonas sp. TaxID=28214 RepID=UPI002E36ED30
MKPERLLPPDLDIAAYLGSLPPHLREQAVRMLGEQEGDSLDRDWTSWAHHGQHPPEGLPDGTPWSTWVLKAGRGFGKTLTGAHWVTRLIALGPADLRIALIGATLEDARRVMVEGRSGLLTVADAWLTEWHPSLRRLKFRTGAEAILFSGASPEMLRGPEHHAAWCDELAKWEKPQDSWDMLQLGLRLGLAPQTLVTTTPRPGPVLSAIMAEKSSVVTGGPTRANPHISAAYKQRVTELYEGSRLGRQELDGELLPDAAGALWSVELIARCRLNPPRDGEGDREAVVGAP